MTRQQFRIYLSGSIKKGLSDPRPEEAFWSPDDEDKIRKIVGEDVELLNPAKTDIRRNDFFLNYGCDLYLVESSDVILVDLRDERGIGVGAELMYARFHSIPVIGWLPENSNYRRDIVKGVFGEDLIDWTHPFAYGLCDYIASSLESACHTLLQLMDSGDLVKDEKKSPEQAKSRFLSTYPNQAIKKHDR